MRRSPAERALLGRAGARARQLGILGPPRKSDVEPTRRALAATRKYLDRMGFADMVLPRIGWKEEFGAHTLGKNIAILGILIDEPAGSPRRTTTTMLDRIILHSPQTFERVVAHEAVHHANALAATRGELEHILRRIQLGIPGREHGEDFLQLAAILNQAAGDPKFVTVHSDESYERPTQTKKPYYVYVVPLGGNANHLGFSVAAKIGPKVSAWLADRALKRLALRWSGDARGPGAAGAKLDAALIEKMLANEERLFLTRDPWFLEKNPPRLEVYGKIAVPPKPEEQAKIRDLYQSGKAIEPYFPASVYEALGAPVPGPIAP